MKAFLFTISMIVAVIMATTFAQTRSGPTIAPCVPCYKRVFCATGVKFPGNTVIVVSPPGTKGIITRIVNTIQPSTYDYHLYIYDGPAPVLVDPDLYPDPNYVSRDPNQAVIYAANEIFMWKRYIGNGAESIEINLPFENGFSVYNAICVDCSTRLPPYPARGSFVIEWTPLD